MIELREVKRTFPPLLANMAVHYSAPKGFVGRNICYGVFADDVYYGSIVGGSATMHLKGRWPFFQAKIPNLELENLIGNIFFHIEKIDGKYPCRNFAVRVLSQFRETVSERWEQKYKNKVYGFETLVELPRTGECYIRDGWEEIGQTVGFTCKREGGQGTDSWTGKRVWNTNPADFRPKRIFCRFR